MHPDPDRLREIPLFEGIGTDQLEQVASWFAVEEHPAGTRLTRAGASGYAFFILEEGHARVEVDGAAVNELRAGDVFGEMAFFADGRRTADVFADSEVRVLAMFGSRFEQLLALAPEVAHRLETLARGRPAG
jgi:NTE family protein